MKPIGYALIDAYNMAFKAAHVHTDMRTSSGKNSSVVYGVMQQLCHFRTVHQGYMPIVVWDAGYVRRTRLSKKAVELGIVPQAYKENREENDPFKQQVHDQVPVVKTLLSITDIPQVLYHGYEADDVIASYCRILRDTSKVLCFTCDNDYFQLLHKNVFRVSRLKGEQLIYNESKFKEQFGLEPWQWVDVGALCGDDGDNIFGVPSCGEITAVKLIKECGTYDKVLERCQALYDGLRATYPDLDEEDMKKLASVRGDKRNPYSGLRGRIPYSGVALAIEEKRVKNPAKMTDLLIAMHKDRVRLAYRLKKMYDDLPLVVPKLFNRWNRSLFESMCLNWELRDIVEESDLFACSEMDRD
jgi:5'-3' exonuclease